MLDLILTIHRRRSRPSDNKFIIFSRTALCENIMQIILIRSSYEVMCLKRPLFYIKIKGFSFALFSEIVPLYV